MNPKNQIAPKTAKVRARRMWGVKLRDKFCVLRKNKSDSPLWVKKQKRFFVLPADAASVEAMQIQVMRAIYMDDTGPVKGRAARFEECLREQGVECYYLERKARAALTALSMKGGE